jgi:hypothetical protein
VTWLDGLSRLCCLLMAKVGGCRAVVDTRLLYELAVLATCDLRAVQLSSAYSYQFDPRTGLRPLALLRRLNALKQTAD